jgi:hypothetical protein
MLESKAGSYEHQEKIPTMLNFQFHIIARTDDITNIKTKELRSQDKFGTFALQTKVSSSKNVTEERYWPDQILLGTADTNFLFLLALVCYVEIMLTAHPNGSYLFGERDNDDELD